MAQGKHCHLKNVSELARTSLAWDFQYLKLHLWNPLLQPCSKGFFAPSGIIQDSGHIVYRLICLVEMQQSDITQHYLNLPTSLFQEYVQDLQLLRGHKSFAQILPAAYTGSKVLSSKWNRMEVRFAVRTYVQLSSFWAIDALGKLRCVFASQAEVNCASQAPASTPTWCSLCKGLWASFRCRLISAGWVGQSHTKPSIVSFPTLWKVYGSWSMILLWRTTVGRIFHQKEWTGIAWKSAPARLLHIQIALAVALSKADLFRHVAQLQCQRLFLCIRWPYT